jgi:hypothetical protein
MLVVSALLLNLTGLSVTLLSIVLYDSDVKDGGGNNGAGKLFVWRGTTLSFQRQVCMLKVLFERYK